MYPPSCSEERLTEHSQLRRCVLDGGHDGDHEDARGDTWPPPGVVLQVLTARWGRTHKFAWTGRFWVATHRDPRAPWRSQIEPTPKQLEARLNTHYGTPPGPPADNPLTSRR